MNGMPALPACVGSVRRQTHREWEHLVQDGGSTDGTVDWLSRQTGLNWRSGKDGGMYDAINQAWARSTGDILSWLNADEQYLPETLEIVRRHFESDPNTDAVFGDCILVTPEGRPLAARKEIPLRGWYAVNGTLYVQSCTLFCRRRMVERFGGFDTSFRIAGDKEWILRLYYGGARFRHVPAYLALFSSDGGNLSLHPAMKPESVRIRERFSAFRVRPLRLIPRFFRTAEKLCRGCYGWHRVRYEHTKNETGCSEEVRAVVGSRWMWPKRNEEERAARGRLRGGA